VAYPEGLLMSSDRLKSRILALSWLLAIACVLSVPAAIMFGLSSEYHPAQDGAPVAGYYLQMSLLAVPAAFVLALWNTLMRNRLSALALGLPVVAFVAALQGAAVYGRATHPQPDVYLRFVGDTAYAVPRRYGASGARTPDQTFELMAEYCHGTKKPKYAGGCKHIKGFPRYSGMWLSAGRIVDHFDVYYPLQGLKVRYIGDRILAIPDVPWISRVDIGNARGYGVNYNGDAVVFATENKQMTLFVKCRHNAKYCTVSTATPYGVLTFPSSDPPVVDPERWQRDQAWHEALFDAWRCAEPTCGGQFPAPDVEKP